MRYRYHWTFKLLALILAVVSGAMIILGCAGLALSDWDWYERERQGQLYSNVSAYCSLASEAIFDYFAWKDTGIEPKLFERFFRWGADVDLAAELEHDFYYSIRSVKNGTLVDGYIPSGMDWGWSDYDVYDVRRGFVTVMPMAEYYPTYQEFTGRVETVPDETADIGTNLVYVDLEGKALPPLGEGVTGYEYYVVSEDDSVNWQNVSSDYFSHADAGGAEYTIYRLEYTGYESYEVEIYMTHEQATALTDVPVEEEFIPRFLNNYPNRKGPLAMWGLGILLLSLLWLALTAGKSPYREEVKPEGLNVIPLDVYTGLVCFAAVGVVMLAAAALNQIIWNSGYGNYDNYIESFYADVLLLALAGGGAGLTLALFTMACSAQMKVGNNFWLKNTLIGTVWKWGGVIAIRSVQGLWKFIKRTVKWFLGLFAQITRAFRRFGSLLPLNWQWLVASAGVWLLMFLCILFAVNLYSPFALFFGIVVTVLLVLYGAYCFGALRNAAKKMSEGSLEEKIDNQFLLGCFGEFASHLNALGDTCIESAKQQMKSERMKSELITNVSHDIKTPLTSIINYVDLLQKTDDEAERAEYLEVLDRQSQRLKKLIEDLMEMSRANSGNVAVEITPTDVTEAVNQALGEFADTLESCGLAVMLKAPAEPVMAMGDGKHLWRVLSNCLSNVVKYAMPGTRVYVDVVTRGQKVEISIKNISARMLNISAEELMERFVRGDSSRNTEGNGLGLNIAKSLMELQGGRLELIVDGDLFKVVLTLNAA